MPKDEPRAGRAPRTAAPEVGAVLSPSARSSVASVRPESGLRFPPGDHPGELRLPVSKSQLDRDFVATIRAANRAGWTLLSTRAHESVWEDLGTGMRREAMLHSELSAHRLATGLTGAHDPLEAYLQSFKLPYRSRVGMILAELMDTGNTTRPRALDVGAGSGEDLGELAAGGLPALWVGCDLVLDQMQGGWARPGSTCEPGLAGRDRPRNPRRLPAGVCPVLASTYRLPFPEAACDLVLASEVLEHLCAPEIALAEWHRVLSAAGTLVLTTPNGRIPLSQRLFFAAVRVAFGRDPNRGLESAENIASRHQRHEHFHEYTPAEVRALVEASGFEVLGLTLHVRRIPDALYGRFRSSARWRHAICSTLSLPLPGSWCGTQVLWARKARRSGVSPGTLHGTVPS